MVSASTARNLLVSVVVPAYNEAETVEAALRRVRSVPLRLEIIVVNDASTDGTRDILEKLATDGLVNRVVHHERNRGKGAAIRSGVAAATGDARKPYTNAQFEAAVEGLRGVIAAREHDVRAQR